MSFSNVCAIFLLATCLRLRLLALSGSRFGCPLTIAGEAIEGDEGLGDGEGDGESTGEAKEEEDLGLLRVAVGGLINALSKFA